MPRARVDPSIARVEMNGFVFPLGVYPVDTIEPVPGYTMSFEPADQGNEGPGVGGSGSVGNGGSGGESDGGAASPSGGAEDVGEWEEWPDRYVYDILVPSPRVEPLVRTMLSIFPGRVYPILDFLGQDEWREVDPYVSYELLGLDRFLDTLRRYRGFFFEDGLVGFGAMSEEPFLYIFVDEHKVVTIRAEAALKDRVEAALAAFDLPQVDEIHSADSVTHEHRGVLDAPDDRPDLLSAEEIVEVLRDEWQLVLNIDPDRNVDDEGNDLGITGWRVIIRYDPPIPEEASTPAGNGSPKRTVEPGTIREAHVTAEGESDDDESDEESETAAQGESTEPASDADGERSAAAKGSSMTSGQPAPPSRYAEVFVTAESLNKASDLAVVALEELLSDDDIVVDPETTPEPMIVQADRWGAEDFIKAVREALRKQSPDVPVSKQNPDMDESLVWSAAWLN